jgi:hypothetical protein
VLDYPDYGQYRGHGQVLKMGKQEYLSNLSQYEGLSLREISRRSGHSFRTVKKYVNRESWNEEYSPRKERESRLEPLKAVIDGWLKEDMKRSRKYRRTGTKIYNDLLKDKEHSKQLSVGKDLKLDLLILDEWGYVPMDSEGTKLLFQVVSACYERRSLIITTNLEFTRWNDIFADTKITAALLDRIIHHSHLRALLQHQTAAA